MKLNEEIIKKLETVIIKDTDTLHEIENICKNIDDINIIHPIFIIFENNLNFDFGNPGDLVRIVEKFYKFPEYEEELYKSVERKPTEYNLWMLNRLLNTFEEERKATGINLFKSVLNSPNVSVSVKDWAKEYLEEQTK